MPKVSIILPTYNGEKYIKESIESVLNQTYNDWELIIVNDSSTDNTLNIINDYVQKDGRIKVITNKTNLKLPASLNVGFSYASGEYYTWTSDDNMYKSDAIEKMVNYLDSNQSCDLVSFNFDFIAEDGVFIKQYKKNTAKRCMLQLISKNNIMACFMYRKEIAIKTGMYDDSMFCAEDYDYWCRIALNGNIHYNNENLYSYRKNSQSLTATKKEIVKEKTAEIRLKYATAIMDKLGLSKEEQIKKLLNFYYNENKNRKWKEIAYRIDYKLAKICQFKLFLQQIFSVKNKDEHKIISILGIKIKLKI